MEDEQVSVRAMLKENFGIVGPFVKVMQLSAVLGVDASTIYRAMRAGRFMMPHTMIMASPVVKLDDFVAWFIKSNPVAPVKVKSDPAHEIQPVVAKEKEMVRTLSERIATEAQAVYGRDLVSTMCEKLGMQHKTGKVASRMR